jgi:hypothetical protein
MLLRVTFQRLTPHATGWRRTWNGAGGATAVVIVYLAFRVIARGFFSLVGMPTATVSVWLLPLGLAIDLSLLLAAFTASDRPFAWDPRRWSQQRVGAALLAWTALGGVAGAAGLYGVLVMLAHWGFSVPAVPGLAVPFALLTGALGGALGAPLAERILLFVEGAPSRAAASTGMGPAADRRWPSNAQVQWERAAAWGRAAAGRLAARRHG